MYQIYMVATGNTEFYGPLAKLEDRLPADASTNLSMFKYFLLLSAAFLFFVSPARAQEEHIYLIKMFDCEHQPTQRSQTGFKVRGLKGVVTALHGIADCGRITASSRKGIFLDQPLKIAMVDIDRDVALLSSSQLDRSDEGLEPASTVAWKSLGTVKVYGHPYGISSLETTLSLRNPPLTSLKDLIPSAPLSLLMERRSPNHLITVMNLQGNLLPGHSGAPVLDTGGRVLAVANGGLSQGYAGISWAVPLQYVEWDNNTARLKSVKQLNPNILFAADTLPTTSSDEIKNDFCGQLSRLVVESRTGFVALVGDPISGDLTGNFKSKLILEGSTSSHLYPGSAVSFSMYKSDKVGWVESQYYNYTTKVAACLPNWEKRIKTSKDKTFRQAMFRENDKSPIISISYNLKPSELVDRYSLRLSIHALDEFTNYYWENETGFYAH